MPLFHQLGRRHSPSRRYAIILPQDWNVLSASMPSLSSYQESEADQQDSTHLTFYHHSNESATTLVLRRLSQGSIQSRATFLDSDSDSSASSSRRASSPTLSQRVANTPKRSWDRRWPFIDDDTVVNGDFELGYPEIDTLGPLGALLHELNDISLSADRPLARLETLRIRDQWAQWMQRCQTLGEIRVMGTVKTGRGIIVTPEFVEEAQSAEFVGFAPGEAEERIRIFNSDASKCSAMVGSWSVGSSFNDTLPSEASS